MTGAGREFDDLAEGYDRHRPTYPDALMEVVAADIGAVRHNDERLVVDVGAGTGIATRLLRRWLPEDVRVVGVEPGEGMRRQAMDSTPAEMGIEYLAAQAEELPFDNGSVIAVVTAQAIQWFDRPKFYAEVVRVLAPGGWLAVLQNNRRWQESAFLDSYESFMEAQNPSYNRNYRSFDVQQELKAAGGLDPREPVCATWDRPMTVEEFLGMANSSSRFQSVVDRIGADVALATARQLAEQHADSNGIVQVRYRSELYRAQHIESHSK